MGATSLNLHILYNSLHYSVSVCSHIEEDMGNRFIIKVCHIFNTFTRSLYPPVIPTSCDIANLIEYVAMFSFHQSVTNDVLMK